MINFALFTDVSVNPQHKLGIGGYLLVPASYLDAEPHDIKRNELSARIKIKRYDETSSTKLEVQTVLWALEDSWEEFTGSASASLEIYTDSQCVAGLMGRRAGLEKSDFIAKRSGLQLSNANLYRKFYTAHDLHGFQLIKVQGHSNSGSHDSVQRIFSFVDREVRKELIHWMDLSSRCPARCAQADAPLTVILHRQCFLR